MSASLRLQFLGEFAAYHNQQPIFNLNSARIQALLAYLILHRASPQPRSQLSYLFWPDSNEAQARANLRNLLHRLCSALPEGRDCVYSDSYAIQWIMPDADLDVARFEQAIQRGRQAESAAHPLDACSGYIEAVNLYAGDLLPGCYEDWLIRERERLRQSYILALEKLAHLYETAGEFPLAIQYTRDLLYCDPLNEARHRTLMRLQSLNGDRGGALQTYLRCADLLRNELQVEPSRLTRSLYEQLLQADLPEAAAIALPARLPPASPAPPAPEPALIGRQAELAAIQELWRQAQAHSRRFLLVSGEAGAGKTRLVQELISWVKSQGGFAGYARCYESESLVLTPLLDWLHDLNLPHLEQLSLEEAARLAGAPAFSTSPRLPGAYYTSLFFSSLAHAILKSSQPLLLVIEDVQWCDPETLGWIHYLLRFDPRAALLVVATLRPEQAVDNPHLPGWLSNLQQGDWRVSLALHRLSPRRTARLAAHLLGRRLSAGQAADLYRLTCGNPLLVKVALAANLLDGSPDGRLPEAIRLAFQGRLERLSPAALMTAGFAAALPEPFSGASLVRIGLLDEVALVDALEELERRGILEPDGQGKYRFSHPLLRRVVYTSLSEVRRQMIQRQIAGLPGSPPDPVQPVFPAEIARQYGINLPESG